MVIVICWCSIEKLELVVHSFSILSVNQLEGLSVPVLIFRFRSMKRLGVFLLPLDGILVHHRLPPSILSGYPQAIRWFPFIHLGAERHCES